MIYVAMAACSGGGAGPRGAGGGPIASSASGGAGGRGGSTTVAGPGPDSGLLDALLDPVPSAAADPQSGRRLKARYRLGDDGAKEYLPGVWFDAQRNETCSFAVAADGQERCLPDGAETTVYSDAACTLPILMMPTGCAAPAYALNADAATCTAAGGIHVLAVGAAQTPTNLYVKTSPTSCLSAGPAATGFLYYGVGAEIPASSFVSATTHHD